ncbi:MAG: hypothetical protein PUA77_08485 [Lachnospiraceae bacterium]|nr:hypothetical protein [Lachnospiraceae bacterium]
MAKEATLQVRMDADLKEQVDQFLAYYPLRIYKAIYETGVKYVSA